MNTYTLSRLRKIIEAKGLPFTILRAEENEFHEPTEEQVIHTGIGLFHASNGYLNISLQDKGQVSTLKQPKLLLLFTDKIKKNDSLVLNKRSYTITGLDNLGELNLCLDLSLKGAD